MNAVPDPAPAAVDGAASSSTVATRPLTGFGRIHPSLAHVLRPQRRGQLLTALAQSEGAVLARGYGRAYGDAAQIDGGTVFDMTRLDRLLDFDPASGILICEAGAKLSDIDRIFAAHGFALPVVPGTGMVSLGGAIAADIHGKNHDSAGSFGDYVEWLDLLAADGTVHRLSPQQDDEAFVATIGGMGLTGIILQAAIRLAPVPSGFIQCRERRLTDLDAMLTAIAGIRDTATYSVAWIDALARGKNLGRGVLQLGEAVPADLIAGLRRRAAKAARRVPFDLPRLSPLKTGVRLYNKLHLARVPAAGRTRILPRHTFLHPLDALSDWQKLYGTRGFVQFQCVVADDLAQPCLRKLLETVSHSRPGALLGVLKTMGREGRGLLSFAKRGHSLALDIPWRSGTPKLLAELERIALDCGGRVYLAKDSALSANGFAAMYPQHERFVSVLQRLDPAARFQSDLARRLGLRAYAP
ncbi:MAG: FAD-binding oxidoreductase [Rhodospirillales bacterium]